MQNYDPNRAMLAKLDNSGVLSLISANFGKCTKSYSIDSKYLQIFYGIDGRSGKMAKGYPEEVVRSIRGLVYEGAVLLNENRSTGAVLSNGKSVTLDKDAQRQVLAYFRNEINSKRLSSQSLVNPPEIVSKDGKTRI